jgi:hypothetical protein
MGQIPPLAGVCTYEEAARVGLGVEETVRRLVRYAWIEKRLMEAGLYWLNPTPDWEVKEALSLHLYLDAEHANLLRERVAEMRNPPPRLDRPPDDKLEQFLQEVLRAGDTLEKIVAVYHVLRPALLAAYRAHYDATNPLIDHPTRRLLRTLIAEEEEAIAWGDAALTALTETPEQRARARGWRDHLSAYLAHAGGVSGESTFDGELPPPRAKEPFQPDYFPRRDGRFERQGNFIFPPHAISRGEDIPDDEKTLALMCKRALEMDVPEAMARMIAEAENQPWEFYVHMCRQLWDEARHAMMGAAYFEAHDIDWRREIPLHPGFSIRLNRHMTREEAHAVLYAIEYSLMPGDTGKKYEVDVVSDDPLARYYQDFDWADEVLHVHIGRRWGQAVSGLSSEEFVALGTRKAAESEKVLGLYADPTEQVNWWPDFVQRVLGHPSAAPAEHEFDTSDPVYKKDHTQEQK